MSAWAFIKYLIHFVSVIALQHRFNCIPLTDFTLITKRSVIMRFSVYSQRYMHSFTSAAPNFGVFCGHTSQIMIIKNPLLT